MYNECFLTCMLPCARLVRRKFEHTKNLFILFFNCYCFFFCVCVCVCVIRHLGQPCLYGETEQRELKKWEPGYIYIYINKKKKKLTKKLIVAPTAN